MNIDQEIIDAVRNDNVNQLQTLLQRNDATWNVEFRNEYGYTALHKAARSSFDTKIAELLLKNGWKVNTRDYYGETPLHYACRGFLTGMVEFLLKNSAEIEAKDYFGRTPLFTAIPHLKIMEMLLHKGAEVNAQDNEDNTPLHYACHHGDIDMVQLLVKRGANFSARNHAGLTPYQYAVTRGIPAGFLNQVQEEMHKQSVLALLSVKQVPRLGERAAPELRQIDNDLISSVLSFLQ